MLEALPTLSAISLGIFAGAQLLEACVMVPFWRNLSSNDFFRSHHAMGPNLFRFFAPVTLAATFLSSLAALTSNGSYWAWAAAGLCLMALLMFFAYFKAANERFALRSISDEQLPIELKRWARWHRLRTAIVVAAFVSSTI